jgi:hypothetical protein
MEAKITSLPPQSPERGKYLALYFVLVGGKYLRPGRVGIVATFIPIVNQKMGNHYYIPIRIFIYR